jgi:hypothetical protein
MSNVEEILAERQKVHGEFSTHARMAQRLKAVILNSPNGSYLTDTQLEGLEMILHKVARILNGNPNHKDHWDDIAGYATLVAREVACVQSTTQI